VSGARTARRWERRLYLGAHPLTYPLFAGLGHLGPAVRLPGVGVVVNSASLARDVLCDTERFVKNGPGSSGALWTPVLGPSVLLNMEGEEHRALRGKLAGLFTPDAAQDLCDRVLGPLLSRLADRLSRGETVDLVQPTRIAAAKVIAELIGLPARDDQACLDLFAAGEEIVAMVKLTTRELSPAQVACAKATLAELVAPAAKAYQAADPDTGTAMGRMAQLGLSEDEVLGAAAAFFLTGTETVATTVPRVVAMLCDHGIAGEPPLDQAIDEAMRVMAPTPAMLRRATAHARVGHVRVRPGDRVIIATLTCTRSAGAFGAGANLKRLWFGAGPHYCIGAPLALAEIRALVSTILDAGPLRVVRRRVSRGVLIPAYRLLEVRRR
jgi:cytochrome P450